MATPTTQTSPIPALHIWRIVALVITTFALAGALGAAPLTGALPRGGSSTTNVAGLADSLTGFFKRLWSPGVNEAEKQGTAFTYDEQGNLLSETGTGGANSGGSKQYIYLPTADGPMPIAVVIDGEVYAVHSDHLNTPRRLTNSQGQAVWQWPYSPFGEAKPTTAATRFADPSVTPNAGTTNIKAPEFNLAFQGMYRDKESGLLYNGFRSFCPECGGRYTQADPSGLNGGPNRFAYADGNPLSFVDPNGLEPKGLPRRPIDLIPLDGGGGPGIGGMGGGVTRWSPPCPPGANGVTPSPALKGSPYHPDSVAARIRPEYRPNPAHDLGSPQFNPRKTPEPADAASAYQNASRGDMGTWYVRGQGGWYRYFSDNAGGAHFSGTVSEAQVPASILRGW
ncbi:RHS repeat-associated core domain-containing protein [Variovorax sp. KK3]|uniref:RHS repeat-associated core domain-containing protein n=1 Tax=Variovorax sp. KK3 TaxID=1855728 RepID=UPI00097C09E6|nr:RHS repeat-associated core domain-containing protein [Variovorax sp. KK3]